MIGTLIGAGASLALGAINNAAAANRAEKDRQANYYLNEQAAQYADTRTRALYNDFYSPQALMNQYKAAGLSPSLMFGGTPGQGGIAGAQSQGSQGLQTQYMPISMMEGAQIAAIQAQTEKTKAETSNIIADTDLKYLEQDYKSLANSQYKNEWELINSTWTVDGKETSLFEEANKYYTYDAFLQAIRNQDTDDELKRITTTESGQKQLRSIYEAANRFRRDLNIFAKETVDANFQISVINCLNKQGFAEQNAKTAISQLEAAAETADLTKEQKQAWNDIIGRLKRSNPDIADIIMVACMVLGQMNPKTFTTK